MGIVVNLDVMMARRKKGLKERNPIFYQTIVLSVAVSWNGMKTALHCAAQEQNVRRSL